MPAQIVCEPEVMAMVTDGVTGVVTLNVITLLIAVAEEAQAALLVSIRLTASPFARDVLLYVLLLVPVFAPFSSH